MLELISQDGLTPFLMAAFLVAGLAIVEIVLISFGISTTIETDGPDSGEVDGSTIDFTDFSGISAFEGASAGHIAATLDIDLDIASQIEAELAAEPGTGTAQGLETGAPEGGTVPSMTGVILGAIGAKHLPLTVWLAIFCAFFAGAGLTLQITLHALAGFFLPEMFAAVLAMLAALPLTRILSGLISRIVPRDETTAVSERSLGRRRGVVTVGTARRGNPAEVRVKDRYNNTHYLMIEPLGDTESIPERSEVLVLRTRDGTLRAVRIG